MTAAESRLVDGFLDETLSREEFSELQVLLRGNAEARYQLRLRASVAEQLSELAAGVTDRTSGRELANEKRTSSSAWKLALPWGIAALLAFYSIVGLLDFSGARSQDFTALLVSEADAVFEDGHGPEEVRFSSGEYRLTEGAAHLRFSNGTDLVMKAPVAFAIEDSFHVALERGGLRAIVPPSGQGFTIATPGIDYEDLGTEFGVSVDGASGMSRVHVFDGQVDAKLEDKPGEILSSVFRGESKKFESGVLEAAEAAEEGEFLTPSEIGYLRWESWSRKVAEDESLIGYFPFRKTNDRSVLGESSAKSRMADGKISGARWVTGRWPGKGALLFDRTTDFAEIEIPGDLDEMTISVWLNVAGLDREVTAILDSDRWDPGDVHLQINRLGFPWVGIHEGGGRRSFVGNPVTIGQWSHVTMVLSKNRAVSEVYVNGVLSGKGLIDPNAALSPGKCRLGNWLRDPEWEHEPVRAFRGRIDELAIWNRSLGVEEIQEIFEAGRPSFLWNQEPSRLTASGH